MAAAAPIAPPPGIVPVDISIRQMQSPTYQLSTGPRRNDTIPYKLFDKQVVLDDVQSVGFYSPFHPVRAAINAYPGTSLLLVADASEKYGSNWYLCVTEEAKAIELDALGAAERAAAEESRKAAEEEERKAAEEHRLATLIVHEQPLVARHYKSSTAEETAEDVRDLSVRRSRPLIALRLQRRRYNFGARCTFNDREYDVPVADFRPRREPAYELKRSELSFALQAGPSKLSGRVDAGSQTTWFAPQNAAVQCDVEHDSIGVALISSSTDARSAAGVPAGVATESRPDSPTGLRAAIQAEIALAAELEAGAGVEAGGATPLQAGAAGGGAAGGSLSVMEQLADVLFRAMPLLDLALAQNETLNIFRNDIAALADEDVVVVSSSDAKNVREERQFMDLELTSHKAIVAVEWHPSSPAWFAVSAMPTLTFEQRVLESGTPRPAHVLLFTLAEFSNQLVLEAPADVTCMHWNPCNASLLAVGLVTGQVALFDMAAANEAAAARKREAGATAAAADNDKDGIETGASTGASGAGAATHVKPRSVSLAESGHGRAVVSIRWLPSSHHLNQRLVFVEEKGGESHQFVSAAGDGTVCVWDDRYRERARTRRRTSQSGPDSAAVATVLQSGIVPGAASAGVLAPSTEIPWTPHYKVALRYGSSAVHMCGAAIHERRPSEPLIAATEEGRVMAVDWAPQGEGTGSEQWLAEAAGDGSGGGEATEGAGGKAGPAKAAAAADDGDGAAAAGGASFQRILWVGQDADRPPVAVLRSPFFPHIFAAVNEFSYSIWSRGVRLPVFTSSSSAQMLTSGRWSPTRPGVLVIGRSDGVLDVWDLLDTTTKPSLSTQLFSTAVSSLEFRSGAGKQLLAVGDDKGAVHLLDFPLSLRRGVPNEEALVSAYLGRESARASYVQHRAAFHEAEKLRKDSEAAREQAAREAHAAKLEAELSAAIQLLSESDPVAARAFTADALEARKKVQALNAAADKYEVLEAALAKELGVRYEDITPLEVTGTLDAPPALPGDAADQQHTDSGLATLQERRGSNNPGDSRGATSAHAASPSPAKKAELRPAGGAAVAAAASKTRTVVSKTTGGAGNNLPVPMPVRGGAAAGIAKR